MEYVLHICVMAGIYVVLAVSLDLLAGYTGLLSLAHAAFFGIGAYSSALITVQLGAPIVVGWLAGMAVVAALSFLISLPSLRLRQDYFVIATFGFQLVASNVFENWVRVTRGPLGIANIPQPAFFGFGVRSQVAFALTSTAIALTTYLVVHQVTNSPFGRVLRVLREDETFAQSLGKNVYHFKIVVFAVSAAGAAMAGALYAHYITYIDPSSFTVEESILIISMVIVGGAGDCRGAVLGAILLVSFQEILRFVGLPSSLAANVRQMCYGLMLVVLMILRPRGLVGRYGFGR